MVYTITFNPAVDYIIYAESIEQGKINKASSEEICYGGKGINVSVVLTELGIKNVAWGFIAGFTGKAIEDGLSSAGVETDFIKLKSGLSRINVKLRSEEETDINTNGPDISSEEIEMLFKKTDNIKNNDYLILAGSIPKSLPVDIYEKLLKRLENKKVNIVVDCTKKLLLNTLKYKPFLIKPNIEEISEIFEKDIKTYDDIVINAEILQKKGARNVLVSMGENGLVFVSEDGKAIIMPAIKGKTVNTVGAGDSMVAGFVAGYIEKADFNHALSLGTAAGAATAFSIGIAKKEQIYELYINKHIT